MAGNFPVDQYLKARQYQVGQQEQQDNELPEALGKGVSTGLALGMQQRQQLKEKRFEMYKDLMSKNMLIDVETGKPVDLNTALQIGQQYAQSGDTSAIGGNKYKLKPINQGNVFVQGAGGDWQSAKNPETGEDMTNKDKIVESSEKKIQDTVNKDVAVGKAMEDVKAETTKKVGEAQTEVLDKRKRDFAEINQEFLDKKNQLMIDSMPDDKLHEMTLNYVLGTGPAPRFPLGNSDPNRARFNNMIGQVELELKQNGDSLASRKYALNAEKTSLANITKQKDVIESFENTAERNLDLAQNLSEKVDRTQIPLLNKAIISADAKILGSVEAQQFADACITAKNEYAKVVTTINGGGANVTDAARAEADKMFEACQTKEQMIGVIKTLKQEMQNRKLSYYEQIDKINKYIANQGNAANPSANNATPYAVPTSTGTAVPTQNKVPVIYHTATNPQTKQKIQVMSLDGGQTWQPVQ